MASPREVRITLTIVDMIALPACLFMAVSLALHLRNLNKSTSHVVLLRVQTAKKYMQVGALGTLGSSMGYMVVNFLTEWTGGGMPEAYCRVLHGGFRTTFFGAEKICVYMFIFWRVSTFGDFFTETAWRRLKVFVASFFVVYLVFFMCLIIVGTSQDRFDTSGTYCRRDHFNPLTYVFVPIVLLLDFIANGVGIVCFVRLLWCNPILGQMTQKDPKVGEAARNVVLWSLIAMVTSLVTVGLTIGFGNFGFIDIDMVVNGFCISMQYRGSLWALLSLVFGWDEEDTEFFSDPSMYEDDKDVPGPQITTQLEWE